MKPRNLISVFQGDAAIESIGLDINKQFAALKNMKSEICNPSVLLWQITNV